MRVMIPAPSERRSHPRRALMRRATVKLTPTDEIGCVIRNISRTGAMLSLEDPPALPPRFVLDMSGNIVVRRVCELVWQNGLLAGVMFPEPRDTPSDQFNLD